MRFKDAEFSKLEENLKKLVIANHSEVETQSKKIIHKFKKGLFLFGNTGRGKTYSLYAIRNNLDSAGNVDVWVETLFNLKQNFNSNKTKGKILDDLLWYDYIFLDDVGVEKDTEWSQEIFYMVVNKIYVEEKTLFMSTNLTVEEFSNKYGDRIMDRLTEICDFYEMKGNNLRKN